MATSTATAAPVATTAVTVRRAAAVAAASAVLLGVVYLVAVRSGVGQRFENAVWVGSGQTAMQRPAQAVGALDLIGTWSVIAAVLVVVGIGLLRRQVALALAGAAVVGASMATTEFLKSTLIRPNLVPGWTDSAGNSFPSGHTTVAMSVMFALILVAPYRFRGLIAFCTAATATEIGALTIVARWHRPSDTLGADLVVLFYAGLAVLVLAAFGRIRPIAARPLEGRPPRGLLTLGPIALGTATAVCGAMLYAALTYYHRVHYAPGYETSQSAFYTGCLIALAGSGLATLALLWLLARLDLTVPESRD
ncbi:phosphatase PAP2 family protein [Actinospica durhamensis]|uniref:Phosphatase PAP2 family protein n=1 Tax=Actinospica durhamensis TaxID=1508375 RepID=A0A941EJJ6_9ACTN|nr:phosphatase PAP2 family protein [Actinospica durhamensis]MBR7832727.1 phosphatase PAP2 family protein [Actinospica durhamensis]